ncbi:MAG TPA: isoprenylcysteine carboxylmethyltransferase family protein [Anaerolineales bacterium]|nr:isoprenylcysteine carboxylmethyltransferase family protein [Anaerolineales bacterium]HUS83851.1 isoprenylcysteine carboxylmethyltransferase family protein [Anaerolineales bacterium]
MRPIIFIMLGLGAIMLSGRPRYRPRSYRFFRLLSFEALLLLVYVNSPSWFFAPFSTRQVFSWILLLGSVVLAIHGFWMLHTYGQPTDGIETTTQLVDSGVFRFIRHPLYTSLLIFGWGVFLKQPTWTSAGLTLGATAFLMATTLTEEEENLGRFREVYAAYQKHTWRMIPFVF